MSLDPTGLAIFMPSIICLLLAQLAHVLLTLFPLLLVVFVACQILLPKSATLPMHIFTQWSIALSFLFTFSARAAMLVVTYYIPLFFQAIKSFSPLDSGLAILPFMLSLVIGPIIAGGLVQRVGYPAPFMIASTVLASIGAD